MSTNNKKTGKFIWLLGMLICLCIAISGVCILIIRQTKMMRANDELESIRDAVNTTTQAPTQEITQEVTAATEPTTEAVPAYVLKLNELGITLPDKSLDWDELHEFSEDIYAWVYVPDTCVDYPVFRHPSDNNYYLRHNVDGSEGHPGCIYTEDYNSMDFSDFNTVLYGHNLSDDTMFSSLHYFDDPDFFGAKDYFIYIYTEDYVFVYQIFAAYEFPNWHLLLNYDSQNLYDRESYIRTMLNSNGRVANFRRDISISESDKLITLSTCTTDLNFNLRYLVAGVLLNPRE